ncbi:SAUR-like auxin-responsive protein family [Actinidia rufa]|uniref:SAUR-like auxin-responsive protein family n=1 Tax=Actinidia rufa TaxID=165716 RepID=A0A7J0GHV3_9ERIC|nr:SAUR-like auxin-responsive protein family [Actinidia rufa]
MSACSKILHIVKLRQMLRRWRKKAASARRRSPSDVPAGHVAICVGTNFRRFVVRASYLNHPVFKKLLVQAEEEYGFSNTGPLAIPCDESVFLKRSSGSWLGPSPILRAGSPIWKTSKCPAPWASGAIWTSGPNLGPSFMGSPISPSW